jgi:hypothetical protein
VLVEKVIESHQTVKSNLYRRVLRNLGKKGQGIW